MYLLLRTLITEPPTVGAFDLANVLYVGKGAGYRWQDHFREALREASSAKATAIRKALGAEPRAWLVERHALVVAGHLSESEAFRLEAVMLHLAGGTSSVTNVVAGHRTAELMVPAYDARVFFGAEDLAIDRWEVAREPRQADLLDGGPPGAVVFVVKGGARSFTDPAWQRTKEPGRFKNSIVMATCDEPAVERRGWDPHHPWSAEEAGARACRFWTGSKASVELWQQLITQRSGYLALVVEDPRDKRSAVRYVWAIDSEGKWEDYGSTVGFGFPLGTLIENHPWLGRHLIKRTDGIGFLKNLQNSPGMAVFDIERMADNQLPPATPIATR